MPSASVASASVDDRRISATFVGGFGSHHPGGMNTEFAFAEQRAGKRALVFSDPKLYSELYVLSARPEQIEQSADVIAAILRALVAAGDLVEQFPQEGKAILQKYTKLDDQAIDSIWPNFVFRPALTPELIRVWEAQAAWAKATGKVPVDAAAPDFRSLVMPQFLSKIRPEAVKLR